MKKPFKKTTYEDVLTHGEALFRELEEREEYIAVTERAAELGITITTSYRHTYTDEFVLNYRPNPSHEGKIPVGYAMELWVDLTRAGQVLLTGDGSVQCSVGAEAVDFTSAFFVNKLRFHELDEVLNRNPICALLEEFLDAIEEDGSLPSPFVTDAMMPVTPAAEHGALTRADVHEGAYTEIVLGEYDGEVGGADSVYFAADAFFPHRLFLHAAVGRVEKFEGEILTLDSEACVRLLDIYENIPDALRHAVAFTDLYMEVCESPLAPPPRAEQFLDTLTICREEEFLNDCEVIADMLRGMPEDGTLTIIW